MILQDFPKIQFEMFGLHLVEPMSFITDTILSIISLIIFYKINKIKINHPFYTYWKYFYLIFGVGSFAGGLGHLFYNYWGISGKMFSWICGLLSVYCIEQAMISIHWKEKTLQAFKAISTIKLLIVFVIFFYIVINVPIEINPSIAFLPIAINTILGTILTAGFLGYLYSKKVSVKFKYIWLGVLIMAPASFIFLLKINIHPWFDKNDFSHVFMALGIIYFYQGVIKISKE
jgi:hypothetical protein